MQYLRVISVFTINQELRDSGKIYKTEQKAGIKNSKEFTEFLHQFSHKSVIIKLVSDVNTGYVDFPLGHKHSAGLF